MIPNDRKYTKEHEWLKIEGNKAIIGITDHAQHELGDIVFVELPSVGDKFAIGDSAAVVESVKAVSNIYTQAGGSVVEVNEELEAAPEKLNEDAYNTFIFALDMDSAAELGEVLTAAEYEAFLEAGE